MPKKENIRPGDSAFFRFASKHLRLTRELQPASIFSCRKSGKIFATPLFLVLLVVEITDITLAIDSIPAIFGITRDPFIVYTSNVFAILGLRAMYFLLAGFLNRLRFLTVGLAFVLAFIGGKMLVETWIHVTPLVSLSIVGGNFASRDRGVAGISGRRTKTRMSSKGSAGISPAFFCNMPQPF